MGQDQNSPCKRIILGLYGMLVEGATRLDVRILEGRAVRARQTAVARVLRPKRQAGLLLRNLTFGISPRCGNLNRVFEDHIHRRILDSGSKAQEGEDSRHHGL